MTKEDHNRYLIKFVKNLKKYNSIEINIPQDPIEEILADPKEYAYRMVQVEFLKAIPRVLSAYKEGKELSKANAGIIEKDGKKHYPGGELIDPKLPPGYEIGNTINHPNQECSNCKFYVRDYCAQWDANIKDQYWCKKWQKTSKQTSTTLS